MTHVWIRAESYPSERRAPVTPEDAATLIGEGLTVTVERSPMRCFADDEYERAGCRLAEPHTWAAASADTFILGLKALPDNDEPLTGRHIYFAHAYKGQNGSGQLLERFQAGNGEILDLEYLVDDNGRRLAAFGYWAGYIGAALAVQHASGQLETPLTATSRAELDNRLLQANTDRLTAVVIGALGRCGRGAADALTHSRVAVTRWDIEQTRDLDREALLDHDILINAVATTEPADPFLTTSHLKPGARLSTVADITCDVGSPQHLLPLYEDLTTWERPLLHVGHVDRPLTVIAIDNLPSLLPRESSADFSSQLTPHLPQLSDGAPWKRARSAYAHAIDQGATT
ncbi:saccharopine dehydrogenase [Natronoglycomyces albus]|uniref:Saccharopine dehydrogenase [NAD(+), L-lysine-forming] n=1 Tax=Natronoglycomyces albus TaxID=2811108 RepID=A0A895XXE2_9ACTN|nr:saccharopine dehydrogenase [Natronoglycomyces albus]QSB06880.1 saccharopine dehydrogenase [Natronoglycomyces albus]